MQPQSPGPHLCTRGLKSNAGGRRPLLLRASYAAAADERADEMSAERLVARALTDSERSALDTVVSKLRARAPASEGLATCLARLQQTVMGGGADQACDAPPPDARGRQWRGVNGRAPVRPARVPASRGGARVTTTPSRRAWEGGRDGAAFVRRSRRRA